MEELLIESHTKSRKPVATLVLSALSFALLCTLLVLAITGAVLLYQRAMLAKTEANEWIAARENDLMLIVTSAKSILDQMQTTLNQTKKCACKH
jgi:hypothetical protein